MKALITLIILFLSQLSLLAQDVVIRNIDVIDVNQGIVNASQDVFIEKGMITAIRNTDESQQPNDINGAGKYLIPGLIDAHIHLFQSGGLYTRPDAFDARHIRLYVEERKWLVDNAEQLLSRYLSQGITSVIDVGGPLYQFALRDSLNRQSNTARVYLTGPLISTYLPPALDVESPPIIKVETPEEAMQLVRDQVAVGTDFIKIWYIARRPQDALDNYPIVEATVKEAKRNDLPIAVHATGLATAKLALQAGADFLVHSVVDTEIDEEFLSMLHSSGAVYCPTLEVSTNYDRVFFSEYHITKKDFEIAPPIPLGTVMDLIHVTDVEDLNYYLDNIDVITEYNQKRDAISRKNLKLVYDDNLPIAVGTDAGNIGTMHVSSFFKEIDVMKEAGMSDPAILKSATINAARTIGKDQEIGSVALGKIADLLILHENPLSNIKAVESIDLIIKQGQLIDAESLVVQTAEQLVQQQVNGYNAHNLEAFMVPYADDVKIYNFPQELIMEGKDEMTDKYRWIENTADLHCEIVNRIVNGNTVIDHERVIFDQSEAATEVIAIYRIADGKIAEVTFIK